MARRKPLTRERMLEAAIARADAEVLDAVTAALPHMTAMVAAEIHANDGDVLGWCDSREELGSRSIWC